MSNRRLHPARSSGAYPGSRTGRFIAAIAGGLVLFAIGVGLSELPLKRLVPLAGAGLIALAGIALGQTRRLLLFAWVVSLTYNRNYFFDVFDAHGSYGPYWIPSDVFLVALLGLWAYESAIAKVRKRPLGRSMLPWFAPLFLACLLSALNAPHPEWTGFEMIRLVRMAIVFWYIRYNLGRDEWWACVAGFSMAILYQVTQGTFYVVTGTELGLAGLFGTAGGDQVAMLQSITGTGGGMRRAQGTLGHPNTLAVYLLMVGPSFIALTLGIRNLRLRTVVGLLAAIAVVGIMATLSRTAWVILIIQATALVIWLMALGYLNLRRGLGILIVAGFAGIVLLAPFADTIYERLTDDFATQIEFRMRHDFTAIKIWSTSPFTGVGLNNYSDIVGQYEFADTAIADRFEEALRKIWEIRITSWVHSIYLLFLAETGIFGLMALLLFFTGIVLTGLRAVRSTAGRLRAACLGLMIGMLGMFLHGIQESVFWIDPITYTTALVAGMLANAPRLSQRVSDTR